MEDSACHRMGSAMTMSTFYRKYRDTPYKNRQTDHESRMPSFKWTRYYPDSGPDGAYPHHSMSCNIIGGNMLVIGGTFPTTDQCDIPTQAGTHNLDLGRQNILNQTWYQYLPNITTYVVPPILVAQIGGTCVFIHIIDA